VGDKADYGARHADAHGASSSDIATWSRSHIASARAVGLVPKSVTDAAARAEIARSRVNDFFIQRWTGGDPEPIAAAVFPLGALLNHSCAPTCVASYRLDESANRAFPTWVQEFRCCAETVRAGDELTHAYVDASDWANHRRLALLDRYGFVCDCARCPKDELGAPFDPPKRAGGGETRLRLRERVGGARDAERRARAGDDRDRGEAPARRGARGGGLARTRARRESRGACFAG
jgi:SET and MYND domain-containing protein